jgi:Sec7-like guanine-nucleotide exchange factor
VTKTELLRGLNSLLAIVSAMSYTNRKKKASDGKARADTQKKFSHSKREYITSEDGWTHVADKGWKSTRAKNTSHTDKLSPSIDMSLEEMVKEHDRYKKQWESSDACAAVKSLFSITNNGDKHTVESTVCLGLGSLQALALEGRRSSHTQLAALTTIRGTLSA